MLLEKKEYAAQLDQEDKLAEFRDHFYLLPGVIYMDGNSLGLLSHEAEESLLNALTAWKTQAIDGWLKGDPPWYYTGEELGRLSAPFLGASPEEVVVTGSTTVNLHNLVASFYHPRGTRSKIVACGLDFPSDRYALASQITLQGKDPKTDLLTPGVGRFIDEEEIIATFDDTVALALLPGVLYRSGQLLDMARLSKAAHERGILIGFDLAHSIGAVPHDFTSWEPDFALWCNYKYLNSGPGSVGGLYVNKRHSGVLPGLSGWWGYDKERQFDMASEFVPASGAGAFQISTIPLLSAAPLYGSLKLFAAAGLENLRAKSLALTDYFIALLDELNVAPYNYIVGTPREHWRRGGHVAVEHEEAARITRALKGRGIIPDFRPPNVIRLAPIPLYTSFEEVRQVALHLKEIIDNREYEKFPIGRDVVS